MQPINIINGSWKQGVEPKVVNLTGTAFMEEAGAHVFHISAEDASGAAIAFTGTVSALFLRADNTTVAIDGEISEGAAEITLVSDCYHVPGRFSIAVYVSDGTDSACVYAAVGNVYRTSSDVVIDSGATIPTLAQLQAAYQACVEATADAEGAAEEAIGNFAPAFAEATANVAGSYVTYTDGKMYLLPNGHTANTTWANTTKSEVKVGGELADLKGAVSDIAIVKNDLDQWLYAKDKYINASFVLTDLLGYDTYRIPCEQLDFITFSWTGDSVFGGLNEVYAYAYEDSNGLSRSLGNANISILSNSKKAMFIAPQGAVAVYFTFQASRIDNTFTIVKNDSRQYSSGINYFENFIIPVNANTYLDAGFYINDQNRITLWENVANYHTWWIHVKAGDKIKYKAAVDGMLYNAVYIDFSGTRATITGLEHTFVSDAIVIAFEKTDSPDSVVIIPNDVKLKIGSSDVDGLDGAISDAMESVNQGISDLEDSIDEIDNKLNASSVTYTEGDEAGYWSVIDGAFVEKTYADFKRRKIEVADWMGKEISFNITGLVGSAAAVYCAFSDASDEYISMNEYALGEQTLTIPSNAKYIYMCFYGAAYCPSYTISANKYITSNDLALMGISADWDGLTGVAFGTSLTYRAQTTGGYLEYLQDMSGLTFDNQGVGSSLILGDGGSLDMLAKIKSYTGYSGKRVCLLEGFINDWYGQSTLGTYTDTAETTVCGCVRSALNYIMSQNANLTVFLILDHYGRNYDSIDCSSTAQRNGKTQFEYYEEIAKVAESLGIPVIKEYAGSQISENTPQYLLDNIHPNALGAKQSANFIWSQMKQYFPNAIN